MDKQLPSSGKQSFTDFANKVTAKWRLRTLPNIPSRVEKGESTEGILRDLIAIPTVTGNYEANHEALEYIDRFLRGRGMYVKRLEWNGVESLVATAKRTKTPTVFLFGHIDVVPGPQKLFQLREEEGKYYGRGVLDMKGAIAAFLGVVQELQGDIQEYDFGIMITTDEEVGGFDGAAKLAEEGYIAKATILPDGGENWNPERFAKGIWHATIESRGKSAHASRPWEGENAIDKLTDAVQEIKALFPKKPDPETSTVTVGMIQGGKAINQIPASATASVDMRFASFEDQRNLREKVMRVLEKYNLTLVTELTADPIVNDPENPYLHAYAESTEKVIGHPVKWVISNASNDGRFFVSKGTQCAIAYPKGGSHHGLEEWISKESILQMQHIFLDYLEKTAKKTSTVGKNK